MRANQNIANLIHLLGCESQDVRKLVLAELEKDVDTLHSFLSQKKMSLDPQISFTLHDLFHKVHARRLRAKWLRWLDYDNQYEQLEAALSLLCLQDQGSFDFPRLLDDLVENFVKTEPVSNYFSLTRYLFGEEKPLLKPLTHFASPQFGNPAAVLANGGGHPSLLVCILMLCGYRLGMSFKGVHLPNQYLARAKRGDHLYLFNCGNNGRVVSQEGLEVLCLSHGSDVNHVMEYIPTTVEMVARVLTSLIPAYHQNGFLEHYHLSVTLLNDLRAAVIQSQEYSPQLLAAPQNNLFKPGQLIRHKRYGYRGVVVDFDPQCEASFNWYSANRSQPERSQPWYHILVNDSDISSYAAESNLGPDVSGMEINHPLVNIYFGKFVDGCYLRNEVKWELPHGGR